MVESYEVLSPEESAALQRPASSNPTQRREDKIKQYRWEKDVKSKLRTLSPSPSFLEASDDFALILSLLPPTSPSSSSASGSASPSPNLRPFTLSLITLLYAQTLASLDSLKQEVALLESMPAERARELEDGRARMTDRAQEDEDGGDRTWRLDGVRKGGPDGKGELMNAQGKVCVLLAFRPLSEGSSTDGPEMQPLRPFTILPSGGLMDERQRLQAEVFRSGHRLPTMSIDEYLQNEFDSGNVITGGGSVPLLLSTLLSRFAPSFLFS